MKRDPAETPVDSLVPAPPEPPERSLTDPIPESTSTPAPVETLELQWELELSGTIVSTTTPSTTAVVGSIMKIDMEYMTVVDPSAPDRIVVTRASLGSTENVHAIGATIDLWLPDAPPVVVTLMTSDTLLKAFVKTLNGDPRSEWLTYLWEQARLFTRDGVELDQDTLTIIDSGSIVNIPTLVPIEKTDTASLPDENLVGPEGDVTPTRVAPERTLGQQYLDLQTTPV